jgi:hypothetical protein
MTHRARCVRREHTRQVQHNHALFVLAEKFRRQEALDAVHVLREDTRTTPGLIVITVVLESIAWKGVIVLIAKRENPAMAGPTRVPTAEKDILRRRQDRSARAALPESTKSVRHRVKIAQPESFL